MAAPSYHLTNMLGSTDPASAIVTLVETDLTAAGWTFVEETAFTQGVAKVMRVWKNPSTLNASGSDFYIGMCKNATGGAGTYLAMRAFEGYTVGSHTMQRPCIQGTLLPTATWNWVAYANGLYVAVGTGIAATSTDGITWTLRTMAGGSTTQWNRVAYGNGVWVAVGNSVAATSPDGITWTSRTIPANNYWGLAFGAGVFVATTGTGTNTSQSSPDGITWTGRTMAVNLTYVAYGNGRFVALGGTGTATAYSTDGFTWSVGGTVASSFYTLTYGNGYFVATPNNNAQPMYSTDGTSWNNWSSAMPGTAYFTAYGNGIWVSYAGGSTSYTTPNDPGTATTWTTRATPTLAQGSYQLVQYLGGQFIMLGGGASPSMATSPDGITWTNRYLPYVATTTTNWANTGATTPQQVDTSATVVTSTNYDVGVLASKSYVAIAVNLNGTGTQVLAWVLGLFNPAYADTQSTTPPLMALSLGAGLASAASGTSRAVRVPGDANPFSIAAGPESLLLGTFPATKEPMTAAIRAARVSLVGGNTAIGMVLQGGERGRLYDAIAVATTGTAAVKVGDTVTVGTDVYTALGQSGTGANFQAGTGGCGFFFNTVLGS